MLAHIRYQDGRESIVSLKDLSPCPAPLQQVGTPGPSKVATPAQQFVTPIPNTPVTRENITHTDNRRQGEMLSPKLFSVYMENLSIISL